MLQKTMKQIYYIFFLLLSACAHHQVIIVDTTNLGELENVIVEPIRVSSHRTELSGLRITSLKDTALTIGAQGGLAWASEQMNVRLESDHKYLDTIFNFYALVLNHGVMPPVLEEGNNTLNLADPNTIRVSDKTYRIIRQAYFATTPPNWREYLWLNYPKPELPDKSLLPRSKLELIVWRKAVREGWEKGIAQGYSIFRQNLARLKRDYRGMLLYRRLLEQKMISPPFVSRTELGVTGDGTDMHINDQVLRIVELPKLQTNSRRWNAIVVTK